MVNVKIGDKYGRWTVVGDRIRQKNRTYYFCRCSCGTEKYVEYQNLRSGISTSCGCYRRELRRERLFVHGEKHTRLYSTWIKMRGRCNNPNDSHYYLYGGRGIDVCEEWNCSYEAFRDWAKNNGYDENLTCNECSIDRIDNNKGYYPENCRWVDRKTQANNKRNNARITFNGVEKTATEWGRELGISPKTVQLRFRRGYPTEDVLYVGNLKKRNKETL